jgi:hypothetical protein
MYMRTNGLIIAIRDISPIYELLCSTLINQIENLNFFAKRNVANVFKSN